jgi:ribosomal protein S18 acetylase RimI-like enzyme
MLLAGCTKKPYVVIRRDERGRSFDPKGPTGRGPAPRGRRARHRARPGQARVLPRRDRGRRGPDLDDGIRGLYLVAEQAGAVVGHAFLESLSLATTSHVVRLTIAVHEGHQRRGTGRALMNELLRWARSNPRVEKVELQVRSSNAPAIALYRSLGFVEEGRKTRRLKIGPGEYIDDVYMALWVGP